jgi:threonine/homoserine/homoserine lactone efflux protein
MAMHMYIAYVLAAMVILVIPGPTIILVISQAVAHGRKSVLPLAAGVVCGDFTAMTLSLCGLGAILAASAVVFNLLKWVGAIYLVYLGIRLWRSDSGHGKIPQPNENVSARSLFRSAYIVTALNPKGIAFFVAFMPQFINPQKPVLAQFMLLGATFLLLAVTNAALYAMFAGQLSDTLRKSHVHKWFNRCGGSALIGAGIITAGLRRTV